MLVGAFEDPRDASRAERVLRTQNLPVFAIDLAGRDGAIRRRLFVGRFATRDLASAAQLNVASVFTAARMISPSEERLP